MVVITLYPLLWVVGSSLNPGTSLFSSTLIPKNATLDHYIWLFTSPDSQYLTWYKNTLKIALVNAVVSVVLTRGWPTPFPGTGLSGEGMDSSPFWRCRCFPRRCRWSPCTSC